MADRLGVTDEFHNTDFPEFIPGITTGRGDIAGGGLTDSAEREAQISFVDDFQLGGLYVVKKGNAVGASSDYLSACGHSVAFTTGALSATQVDDLKKACTVPASQSRKGFRSRTSTQRCWRSAPGVPRSASGMTSASRAPTRTPTANWRPSRSRACRSSTGALPSARTTHSSRTRSCRAPGVVADGEYDTILGNYNLAHNALEQPGINLQTVKNGG